MSLSELCRRYGIDFKKRLGQNLLLDENINRIMCDAAALGPEDDVIEVGAGLGALTGRLAKQAGRVLAVEIDRAFMPCLEDQFGDMEHVRLFRGDILNHSLVKLVEEYLPEPRVLKMISNLPYYITTPILFHFWEAPIPFERLVVMVQDEVGQRMVAPVGHHDYGVLSLAAKYHGDVDIVHHVPATCFVPRPKVDSCIVRIRRRATPLFPELEGKFLSRVIRAAFSQRRKTLRNALSGGFGAPQPVILDALSETGIDPNRRAQTVSLEEYAALALAIRSRL
jgi:16S rRNA (adenine1518-N6/adenine1519-N6)-dimethyltransferase